MPLIRTIVRILGTVPLALTVASLPLRALAYEQNVGALLCAPKSKVVCGPSDCDRDTGPSKTWMRVDLNAGTYSRCDSKGCDTYDATITESGLFTIIELSGRGASMKLQSATGDFVDLATAGTSAFISHGKCRAG